MANIQVFPVRSFIGRVSIKDGQVSGRYIFEKGVVVEISSDDFEKYAQFGLRKATDEEVAAAKKPAAKKEKE